MMCNVIFIYCNEINLKHCIFYNRKKVMLRYMEVSYGSLRM